MIFKSVIFGGLLGIFVACSPVTIRSSGTAILNSQPSYEQSYPFFALGLFQEEELDVVKACGQREFRQAVVQYTALDVFFAMLTTGIYSPRTVKVWCEAKS